MKGKLALAGACLLLTTPASSEEIPDWKISEICASENNPGYCAIFEREARRAILGGWGVLPESYRKECLAQVKGPYDRSYRLLSQCLEAQSLKGLDKDAIKTAATAPEPLSPPKAEMAPPPAPRAAEPAPSPPAPPAPAAAAKPAESAPPPPAATATPPAPPPEQTATPAPAQPAAAEAKPAETAPPSATAPAAAPPAPVAPAPEAKPQ